MVRRRPSVLQPQTVGPARGRPLGVRPRFLPAAERGRGRKLARQIAENGAVVPIEISSNIPGTSSIAVVIEKNPFPLAGKFDFKEATSFDLKGKTTNNVALTVGLNLGF